MNLPSNYYTNILYLVITVLANIHAILDNIGTTASLLDLPKQIILYVPSITHIE